MRNEEALSLAINHLRTNWFEPNVGIVAATLVDDDAVITATSRYIPELNTWMHAEAATLHDFWQQYRRLPGPSSQITVTLSPCVSESSSTRYGDSCSHLLRDTGIGQVNFGWLDTKQTKDVSAYKKFGIEAKLVPDLELQRISHNIYDLFNTLYGPNAEFAYLLGSINPWKAIKEVIGLAPFE